MDCHRAGALQNFLRHYAAASSLKWDRFFKMNFRNKQAKFRPSARQNAGRQKLVAISLLFITMLANESFRLTSEIDFGTIYTSIAIAGVAAIGSSAFCT